MMNSNDIYDVNNTNNEAEMHCNNKVMNFYDIEDMK